MEFRDIFPNAPAKSARPMFCVFMKYGIRYSSSIIFRFSGFVNRKFHVPTCSYLSVNTFARMASRNSVVPGIGTFIAECISAHRFIAWLTR